ncbi:MAG TPA: glycosyltransferase family 2 protein [Planctomycetes bacterium]|nr:glycosyltransferase family 2 protein [Planctomycetota bacterium]
MDSETNPQDPGCRSDLSVLIPLYNEEATIGAVLDRILDLGDMIHEVIVVDDGSSDGSADAVEPYCEKDERIRLIRCEKNKGKTNAIRTALEHVTGEIVVIQDADLEYDPHELPDVVRPIQANKADVVYGSRFLVRRATRVLYFYHFLANRFLTFLSNLLTNRNMTDIETCYKAFYAPVITELQLTSKGFGMEVEITAMICRTKARTYEVPISYYGRTFEEGKKIRYSDGLAAIYYILHYNLIASRFKSRRKYVAKVNEQLEKRQKLPHEPLSAPRARQTD